MVRVLFLGAVALLICLAVSLILWPASGRFDGRALLALAIAAGVVLNLRAVEA
ncbi:hypothetical protein PBI_KEPLER_52 [Arthrobacter phage Kepler]|uniref:Uncharacterized protein n=8 Tax=Coralvirus TaxID=2733171 RepID=A0A5J6TQP0_9CAUD|nr:membrane protein [Arthrobacter phage Coral]YP_009815881.1 membrane protein [Arthrobacter phage Kepler]AYN57626.1 hypothetical protein PBI_COTE_53 [Arthrobacter phage Cote]AYN57700.1 hypothetical protein PBI_DAOB_53 [Arthrobacter phage Daob]AYN58457.1 hypothetical protein PBI_LUNAR_52 [Arthrobacter phage Lunar]AYN58599.1 hypothetical protein PBI_MELONS_52 [Arthrobacter phage Melons]AYN58807.1 hypothetical protein PBI_POLKA_51 [Arthrobacter phage Polka]QFG13103.1 hypothetical protein PBI_AM